MANHDLALLPLRGGRVRPRRGGPAPLPSLVGRGDLEPSLVAKGTYVSRMRLGRIDLTTVLGFLIVLLCLIPARSIVPGMGGFGRPALMVGLGVAAWWFVVRLNPRLTMTGPQPIRWAALALLLAVIASYIAGHLRGLPSMEANGADRSLIGIATYLGIVVMTADGIPNRTGIERVLRTFVWCAATMAVIGMVEVVFKTDLARYLTPPGLTLQTDLIGLEFRGDGGLFRIASTAMHYIEFSAVMAIALPFAIHLARFAETSRRRQLFLGASVVIGAAIPLTLSRTGVLAAIVVIAAMFPAWPWRTRYNVLISLIGLVAAFVVVKPGLLGTLKSLFVAVITGEDNSVAGRTDDYGPVYDYFVQRPWFGRGPGTFIPQLYRFLDSQWLGTLIEMGIVGVVALAGFHVTAIAIAQIARRRATNEADRHLCAALAAAQWVAVVSAFTFDSLGFSTFATMVMLVTGATGAMWRLTHPARTVRTSIVRQRAGEHQAVTPG